MQLNSYLIFNGECEAAFRFYEQCLGGKIEAMTPYTGSPMENHVPAQWRDKILHARMTVGTDVLMASDAPPGSYEKPQGFSVCITLREPSKAQRIFQALAENGTVRMAYQKTFWAAGFGMLVDRFGIPWMINCENQA